MIRLDPATLSHVSDIRGGPLAEPEAAPTMGETWSAAFSLENDVANAIQLIRRPSYQPDEDPDAWIDATGWEDSRYARDYSDLFVGVRSETEARGLMAQIDLEERQRSIAARSGWRGALAGMAAGVASPTTLIPVGGWYVGASRAARALGTAIGVATGVGIQTAGQEVLFQRTQALRTTAESVFNIAGSALLGGVLGAAAGALTRQQLTTLGRSAGAIPATAAEQRAAFDTLVTGPGSAGAAATDAARGTGELASALGAEKAFSFQDPLIRLQTNELQEARNVVRDLAETPLTLAENYDGIATSIGGSVETRAKMAQGPLVTALQRMDDQFASYWGSRGPMKALRSEIRGLTGTAAGKLTYTQFKRAVDDAMIAGDVHPIPQVQASAVALRQAYDRLAKDAIDAGVPGFKEAVEAFAREGLDAGYVYRVWNREAIKASRAKFVEILTRHFMAKQGDLGVTLREMEAAGAKIDSSLMKAADMTPDEIRAIAEESTATILGLSPNRMMMPDDIVAGPRGPLKERVLRIPTELVKEFIERDPEVKLRMATRTMATDTALVRRFGSVDLAEQIAKIGDEAARKIAANPDQSAKITKAQQAAIRDITGIRDRLRGNFAMPDNPEGLAYRSFKVLRNLNYVRLLGGMQLSAIPDIARPVFIHGLTRTLKTLWNPLIHGLSTFKLAANELKLAGTALDMVLDSRTMAMADVMDDFGRGSKFERGLSAVSQRFGVVSLMAPWNAELKKFVGVITQTRMLQAIEKVVKGTASPKEVAYLAAGGIDANIAERIWRQFDGKAPAGRSFEQRQGEGVLGPVFFSAVLRTMENAPLKKGSADQWLGTIRNAPGVKGEELDWIGLEPWLREQKGSVDKAAVEDFIRANQVQVQEVVKGDDPVLRAKAAEIATAQGHNWDDLSPVDQRRYMHLAAGRRLTENGPTEPKFSQYQLPGGENYRELLLTLPPAPKASPSAVLAKAKEIAAASGDDWATLGPNGRANYEDSARSYFINGGDGNYASSHWDEDNVLAHVRFSERTVGNQRILHIEEIQSDWHQAGRKKGYRGSEDADRTRLKALEGEWDDLGDGTPAANARRQDIAREMGEITDRLKAKAASVPDAPFKTTWPELALKRMTRWAAENDFDEIAWTPGKVQAERYDLSKQISRITYTETGNSKYLKAFDHSGKSVIERPITNPAEELPDIVGKDVAEKLLAVEPVRTKLLPEVRPEDLTVREDELSRNFNAPGGRVITVGRGTARGLDDARAYAVKFFNERAAEVNKKRLAEGEAIRELAGIDLKVGGEGMIGFYDKMLVGAANKLGKKFGTKVGSTEIDAGEFKVMRDRHETLPFRLEAKDNTTIIDRFATAEEAWAEAERRGGQKLHSMPITDAMRDTVKQGQPLFQKGKQGALQGRITLEDGRAVIELFKARDKSTFMHEAGHLWLDEMARDAVVSTALKGDFDTVLKWLGASDAQSIGRVHQEKWARAWERYLADGKAPTPALAAAFERFKNWLTAIYRSVRGVAADIPDDIRGVMDRLLAGTAPDGVTVAAERAVFDDARKKLLDAGMVPDEADINASVVAARYTARASRLGSGQTAKQLYDDAAITIRDADSAAPAAKGRGVRDGEVWWANTSEWTDQQAIDSFRAFLVRDVDRAIVTPGQDKPLWMSTSLGKVIGQFKSFAVASVQRTIIAGLQQRDMAALNGALLMLGLGAVTYAVKEQVRGAELSTDPAKWAVEAFDYSGLSGWLMEANNMIEKVTRGTIGASALTGEVATRYASRNALGAAMGPSFDLVGDIIQVIGSASAQDWRETDTHTLRKLLPLQNLWYLRQLFDRAESGVNAVMGVRPN